MPGTRSTARAAATDSTQQTPSNGKTETKTCPSPGPSEFTQSLQRFQYSTQPATGQLLDPRVDRPGVYASPKSTKSTSSSRDRKRPPSHNDTDNRSPVKRRRESSKYAPPSKYAHLSKLTDILEPNLICVFVGTNPGIRTATAGHAYAHPSNLFWKLLHSSGCTDRRCRPEEDVDLPRLYEMGNTNIVERPSRDAAELSKAEMAEGTPILEAKIRQFKPEAVCIVGKGIWEAIWRYRHGKNPTKQDFRYGWQDEQHNMGKAENRQEEDLGNGKLWRGAKVFVTSSTSGLSASLRPPEKEAIWKPFGEWVKARRHERTTARAA